jgi:hypothetical protein
MTSKRLFISAALLVVIAVLLHFYNDRSGSQQDPMLQKSLMNTDLVERIDEIVIETPEAELHLAKVSEGWVLKDRDDYPVDMKALFELLDKMTHYRPATVITRDAERLAHFKLQSATETDDADTIGKRISFRESNRTLFSILIGRHREAAGATGLSQPDGTYIRIGDETAVYLIKENLQIDPDSTDWIRKTLIGIEQEQIKAIRFETPTARFAFERDRPDDELVIPHHSERETIDSWERSTVLNALKSFEIDDIIRRNPEMEKEMTLQAEVTVERFDQSVFRFQLMSRNQKPPLSEGEETTSYYLTILPSTDPVSRDHWSQLYYLSEKWLFTLSEWKAKQWLKQREDFIKPKTDDQ